MWPFRKQQQPSGDGMTITPQHIELAAKYLARCAALHPREGMLFEHFVEGDAWYDQGPLAISFGLDARYDEHTNVVYSYLGLMFFLAADYAGRVGSARIESRGGLAYFMLTKEGQQEYPSPPV